MKRFLLVVFIMLIVLSSCSVNEKNDNIPEISTEDTVKLDAAQNQEEIQMKLTSSIILTNKTPILSTAYAKGEITPPTRFDNIIDINSYGESLTEVLSRSFDITADFITYDYTVNEKKRHSQKVDVCGIIDNKEGFAGYFESMTKKEYKEFYTDDFFEKNILVCIDFYSSFEEPFLAFEYGFDTKTRTIKIVFTERPHEGWEEDLSEEVGEFQYFIEIPKDALKVNGEIPPYEEITVDVSGTYVTDP